MKNVSPQTSFKDLYQPGRKMVISAALSCLSSHKTPDTKETVSGLNVNTHKIGVFSNTDNTSMQSIRQETQNDTELQILLQYIMKGFPMMKDECHDDIKPYFNYREELTVVDGLVLEGQHIVIPSKLRQTSQDYILLIWELTKPYIELGNLLFGLA